MKHIALILSVFASCIVCLFLGSQMVFHGDFFYLSDQARDFTLARDIALYHKLTLIGTHSGLGGLFHGPLWLYVLVPFFLLGSGNLITFTYLYMLIPIVTIGVAFILGRKLYGDFFGALVAFLLAINPITWGYINATQAINLIPLLYTLFIYFSITYIRGNEKSIIFVSFLAGLSFQFETASAVALIPVALAVFFLGWSKKIRIKTILLSILAFIVSLSTFILFDLRHHFLIFTSTLQLFNQHEGHKDFATLSQRVTDHLLAAKSVYMSPLFYQKPLLVILAICIFGYFCFVFFKSKTEKLKIKEFVFLFFTPALVYLFYMLYPHPIYGEYVLDLVVSLIFALTLVLVVVSKNTVGKVFVGLFILFTCVSVAQYLKMTFPYTSVGSAGSYLNQKIVVDWIWKDAKGKPFGYFVYTPETFTYGMDYLFWWESKMRHMQAPESKKLANTYLILYSTLANDTNGHEFWKTHTLHTNAKVIEQKKFSSGIIVEKVNMQNDGETVDPNYYQNLIFR